MPSVATSKSNLTKASKALIAAQALEVLSQRRKEFIDVSKALASDESPDVYLQQSGVDDIVIQAETIMATVASHLEEVNGLIDSLTAVESTETSPSVTAQEDQPQTTGITASSPDCTPAALQVPPHRVNTPIPSYFGSVPPHVQVPPTAQVPRSSPIQLEKLAIEPFYGDITQFHKFWYSFELAVHNDQTIDPVHKYLYLHSLLKGEAQIVLQDLRPQRPDYHQLVELLHKRYNRPHKIRAMLHKRLQQLPQSRGSGSELRNTWFRITGILHGLREYEDFKMVLPLLDLVKSKFPMDIRQKLHDVEFQSGSDFDLDQVMSQLDRIISSREKYEDSCTLGESFAVQVTSRSRSPSRSHSPSNVSRDDRRCCFCDSHDHSTIRCRLDIPVAVRRNLARLHGLCWLCLRKGHITRSCNAPPCRYCRSSHHEMLCENAPHTNTTRRSTSREQGSHRSRREDYRERHRSPRNTYGSRSPSRDSRNRYHSPHSDRSRSYSRDRNDDERNRERRSRSRYDSTSPKRVSFPPVRHRGRPHMRCDDSSSTTSSTEDD